ncbi:uncharacterized protein LOC118815138 isoform X2 [Colossoma macropomum]|uniref:uncharacterized protein LOC118815138 isoform X2 n=1 Tax=Colossoma macropomum TaxID=42526 RepID=UPI0018641C16|nr:uncharacterized protein LOC118815138 isoform X2 [Colossoma macropomum]
MMLVFKPQLSIFILIGLFTGKVQQTAVSRRGAADESGELWRLHEGVSYLFGEAEGSCTEALNFCQERGATIAVITTTNKDWIESQAEGRKLWMNMDDLVTGLSTMSVHRCPERQSSDPVHLNSTEKRGCVCERRREESPSKVRHLLVRAASFDGEDDEHFEGNEYYNSSYTYDYYSEDLLIDPTVNAAPVLSVKIYIITVSVLASLRPLNF